MVKRYILDTNILMTTEGKAISGFDDNEVVIPSVVLEELDNLKMAFGEKGYQAREAIRKLDEITNCDKNKENDYTWKINDGRGRLVIYTNGHESYLPDSYNPSKPDNMIINTAIILTNKGDYKTFLVTNDISMKIKALSCKLNVQSYYNDQVDPDFTYSGRIEIHSDIDIASIFEDGTFPINTNMNMYENQYVFLEDGMSEAMCIYKDGLLTLIPDLQSTVFGISAKNVGQRFALDALMAPPEEIPLVLLKGSAGTGKTLLSLAAALAQTDNYDKIVCARSNTLADADIGALPGDIQEKTLPLLAPITDNLTFLLCNEGDRPEDVSMEIKDMFETGFIEVTSLAYIRGRSLVNTFMIIDECQNLTRLQAKTIVTRAGEGTKVVMMGDLNQIDSPKLDKRNNGLAYLSEKFKGSPLCAQIEFEESESVRSPLALEAINRLQN